VTGRIPLHTNCLTYQDSQIEEKEYNRSYKNPETGRRNRMHKIMIALILGAFAVLAGSDLLRVQSDGNSSDAVFKVLNPWAEVDPIVPRGTSPRLNTLAGKKIGLFANFKRAARPIAAEVGKRLKTMYPDSETSLYDSRGANVVESETKNREKFMDWVKGKDAVILAVGD
jgi:hypothetical protein